MAAKYDLTSVISRFLDRHMVFPLLEFLQMKKVYPEADILQGKIQLLSKTNMVDFAMDIYKGLNETEVPEEMIQRREAVVQRLEEVGKACAPIMEILADVEAVEELRLAKKWNMQYLQEERGITKESLESLYDFAKFHFDCGNYSAAADYLWHYRVLSTNAERSLAALWGKLAAEILMQNWEAALEDLNRLKDIIDSRTFAPPLVTLQQRTWLIHWALFVFFNHPNGRNGIIDLFIQEQRYLNAIQLTCPHILRYLTAAVITNKRRRSSLKDLVKVLQQEAHSYKDPITDFLTCLYVDFDFEDAQHKLRECEVVLANDFFLVACQEEFIENARLFIFETYCRIHQTIDIGMLAEKLNMDEEAAERWIVNLIRNARLDAKIDSKANHVIMGTQYPSIYQQIIDKTKPLVVRTSDLMRNLTVS